MVKAYYGVFMFLLIGLAWKADAQKADSVKVDTALIDKYRVSPPRNSIPAIYRPIGLTPQFLPVQMPDYSVSYWHKNVLFGLNFNQSAFSSNYSAGGVSSIALGSNFDYKVEYNKKPVDFTSETNLIYGISANKGQGARKTNDRIFFDNKISTQFSKQWSFFGALTFESQFTKGYNYQSPDGVSPQIPYLISNFMSPGYLTESIGFEYQPAKYFDLRFGTGTARQTFVLDTTIYHNQPTNYGVPIGHTIYNELAVQIVGEFNKDLSKNIHLDARYAIFTPYIQPLAYTSHRIDATLTAKLNRLIAMTVNATVLYDKNTSDRVQGTEGLALGVLYKLP